MKLIKRIAIGIIAIITLEIILLSFVAHTKPKNTTPTPTPTQTWQPFYYHPPKKSSISVLSSSPRDQEKNVSLTHTVSIQFNKSVSLNNVALSFAPQLSFQTKIINSLLIAAPDQPLIHGITYYGFVTIEGIPSYIFRFTTLVDKSQLVAPDFANEIESEINKHEYPDSFLAGFTPYTTSSFTVISNYTTDKPEHFFFVVTLFGDKMQATQDFVSWATATGLTKEQLDTMDIRYN